MEFASLAALEVVQMTTSSAASDGNFVEMKHFGFKEVLRYSNVYS